MYIDSFPRFIDFIIANTIMNIMVVLPKIEFVASSLETEQNLFLRYLDHPQYPSHRGYILKAFPELEAAVEINTNVDDAVSRFLNEFYDKWGGKIREIVKSDKNLIDRQGYRALHALTETMDYSWPNPITYHAVPTILPFSPFNETTFFFSILGRLKDRPSDNVIIVATHEISHFIFFDILSKLPHRPNVPNEVIQFVKEALTTALLNMSPIRETLNIDTYKGNPETQELYVRDANREDILFVEYLRNRYASYRDSRAGWFNDFLYELTVIMHDHNNDFREKIKLWNKFRQSPEDERLVTLAKYREPIQI